MAEVEIGVLFTDRVRVLPARSVTIVSYHEPNRELADELDRNGVMSAIHDAAQLARRL